MLTDASLLSFCRKENNLSYQPENCEVLKESLTAMADLLGRKDIVIESAKRYMHFVRAILGFEASRATLAENLVKRAPRDCRDRILGRLRDELLQNPPM